MRTIIELTDDQIARLEQLAEREKISRAEAIRRAIDVAYPASRVSATLAERRREAFGLWRGRAIDALEYVDALRDEWESPRPKRGKR